MKTREPNRLKLHARLDALTERLAEARAESKRVAAGRVASEKKIADIGRHLASLKAELGKLAAEKRR